MTSKVGLVGLVALAGIAGAALALELRPDPSGVPPTDRGEIETAQLRGDAQRHVPPSSTVVRYSLSPVVKKAAPAVVNVYATRVVSQRGSPLFNDPFFRQFFGDMPPTRRAQQSLGSGVIVDAGGIAVTNLHVIADADEVKAVLSDQREVEADIVLKDRASDLAVLRLKGNGPFPFLELADSDSLEVGDLVLAIGNPFGVGQTVTSGIISALARTQITRDDEKFYLQTDAAINPGNSGGGLIDANARLVGINSAIFSPSGASSGIGFAIPSNVVRLVVESALTGRPVRRPWLGASLQPLNSEMASALQLDRLFGALVADVTPGGPAAKAGLKPGDVVSRFDGEPVADPGMLNYRIATAGVDRKARLTVLREGKTLEIELGLVAAPLTVPRDEIRIGGASPFTGATVVNLSPAVVEELGLRTQQTTSGAVVVDVDPNSPAGRLGLRRGDIVLDVNGTRIDTTRHLDAISNQATRSWRFAVEREGRVIRSQVMGG